MKCKKKKEKSHHTRLYSALQKVTFALKITASSRHTSGLGVTAPECRFCWSTALQGSRSDSGLGMSEHPGLGEWCGGVRLRRSSLSEQWETATGAEGAPDNGFSFLRDPVCHIQYEVSRGYRFALNVQESKQTFRLHVCHTCVLSSNTLTSDLT